MKSTTTISIADIQIGERFRKDIGDIRELAQSIAEDGLLQPIGVTPDNRLVFGYRRLLAFRDVLTREEIPAVVIDIENLTRGEWIENTVRKDLTLSEMVAITDALRSYNRGGDRRSDQYRKNGNGVTKKDACEIAGWKLDRYDDAKKVAEGAVPELVAAMDREEVSPHAAAKLTDESEDVQRQAVKKLVAAQTASERRGILKTVSRIKKAEKLTQLRQAEIDAPKDSDSIRLYHCPFQQLQEVASLKSSSAQCVLTDIPYGNDFLDQLETFARFAAEVLVEGGVMVSYLGQHKLNEKLRAFDEHLKYQWMGTSRWQGTANPMHSLNVVNQSIPFVIYTKGERDRNQWMKWKDTLNFDREEKAYHPWQRPLAEIEMLLRYFTRPGDLVVDPCGGGFTTAVACQRLGRKCISCDIEKAYVVTGQQRLSEVETLPIEQEDTDLVAGEVAA